jgi:uncharacterized protein with HEPN domain
VRDDRERLQDLQAHPEEVWAQAAGLRNVIVHEYFGIDREILWGVIERDLPDLKQRAMRALESR